MPRPPLDLVPFEGAPPFADFKPVCMDEYIKQNKRRWLFRTSIGDVVLKKLSQLDRDRISLEFFENRPELVGILQEAEQLRAFERKGIPLDEAHKKRIEDCGKMLIPQQRLFSMACFETPSFKDLEEYDAFLTALTSEEIDKLYTVLNELTSIRPATPSCEVLLMTAKEYGIPISESLTLENMTAEQADILLNSLEKRAELIRREMENAK